MNVEKTKVVRISRQPSPAQIMINQKRPENVKYSIYLGNMITDDAKCTREIQSGIDMAKAAFNKMETLFQQQTGLHI
jgi:predicted RNA-binding protein